MDSEIDFKQHYLYLYLYSAIDGIGFILMGFVFEALWQGSIFMGIVENNSQFNLNWFILLTFTVIGIFLIIYNCFRTWLKIKDYIDNVQKQI